MPDKAAQSQIIVAAIATARKDRNRIAAELVALLDRTGMPAMVFLSATDEDPPDGRNWH